MMPIIPASHRVDLKAINEKLGRHLHLVDADDAACLFFDCEEGAIPPMGAAYGIPMIIDDGLLGLGDIYFEGGDHVDLVHMGGAEFFALVPDSIHASVSRPLS